MGESTLIGWIFGGHDKPFRDLDEDVHHRAQTLEIYFSGMEKSLIVLNLTIIIQFGMLIVA